MKTVLITGATSGIGKNLTEYLAQSTEYKPVIVARNEENLKELSEKYAIKYIQYDLNDINNIPSIFTQLKENQIELDGLVHCAGISPLMLVKENDIKTMLETFNVNFFSFIELAKGFVNFNTTNNNKSIVGISSVAAKIASYRQSVYGASKAALEEATKCMAKEFMQQGIRVNTIAPGVVNTEMLIKLQKESVGLKEKLEKLYPLGIADPIYFSKMITYLLSDDSKYITGQCIEMDSGFFTAK
ncbi:MAG: SDR family oxidoreductase [Spirochaetia bacterium]|nr:SDR family oxidoreductase [Spirochaetia bacterium]